MPAKPLLVIMLTDIIISRLSVFLKTYI